jgi:hypothetical protein
MIVHNFSKALPQASSIVEPRMKYNIKFSEHRVRSTMNKFNFREPTLFELLAEPIVQDVMRRDGVRRESVVTLFEALRARHRKISA